MGKQTPAFSRKACQTINLLLCDPHSFVQTSEHIKKKKTPKQLFNKEHYVIGVKSA